MKKIIVLAFLAFFSLGVLAQESKINGKIHLTIEKFIDGKKTVIDKKYDSIEEMKNDPELDGMDLEIFDDGEHKFVFKEGDDEGEMDINVMVEIDEDSDVDISKELEHVIFMESDSDDKTDIKVWIDEDGKKHIWKNGEEVDSVDWEDMEDHAFEFKTDDGKMIIITKNGKRNVIHEGHDGDDVEIYKLKKKGDQKEEKEVKKVKVMVSDGNTFHIKELHENNFEDISMYEGEKLELKDISYYPDLDEGKFKLLFKGDSNPTEIKLYDAGGELAYSEKLDNFKGKYSKEIDISGKKKGIYLLQIIQGDKAFNKKIVLD